MTIRSVINISLRLDKFFLSKKEKKLKRMEIISTLNEASNSIQEILELEGNIEEMALILESNYRKAYESLEKANDLIRVYFVKGKLTKLKKCIRHYQNLK